VIRLLLDQGLPRSTCHQLAERGIDACHVADIGYSRANDPEIIELARGRGQVIVTLDADFHRLLAVSGTTAPSVIRIRQEGLRGPEVACLIHQVLTEVGSQLEAGAVVTVTERRLRLHHLPLRTVAAGRGKRSP
jgi:predicted nuclease of predicted toxin-antitoxin system